MSHEKQHINEEEALQEAISPIVNRLIDKNFENSGDKIASQMAPLIGGAIREQIKSQKDDVVDALYPVMGNMISKFVTKSLEELLNKINTQIQNGLSIETIKRKIKAKLKGVSESELLIQENNQTKIKAVLLIHKESGTLLSQVENEQSQLNDPDMLASMMTAIRSFVNDWASNNATHSELGEIEYGGNKIIIEASGYSYLSVITEGAISPHIYKEIREVLEDIVLNYADEIKKFNGNFDKLPKDEIEKRLQTLINNETQPQSSSKKMHPLIFIIPFLLIGYLCYAFYQDYVDYRIQSEIYKRLEQVPALSIYKINIDVKDKIATIDGKVPFKYHKNLLQENIQEIQEIQEIKNNILVTPTLTDPLQVSSNIAYFLAGLNQDKHTNLSYSFDYNTLTLYGIVKNTTIKNQILQELQKIKGIQNINYDNVTIATLTIDANIYFTKGSSQLSAQAQTILLDIISKINNFNSKDTIVLNSYSDMIGDQIINEKLAKKRLKDISDFFKDMGNLQNKIGTQIHFSAPPNIDLKKEAHKARCVNISLKNEEK